MSITEHDEPDDGLPPPGSRWGAGAHSVLPYLTKSLQARPAGTPEASREARQQRERECSQGGSDGHPGIGQAAHRGPRP